MFGEVVVDPFFTDNGIEFEVVITNPTGVGNLTLLASSLDSALGDFDSDGVVGLSDIETLANALQANDNDLQLDLDDSGTVTFQDMRTLVESIKNTWFGDSNLDGEFNTTDLITVFQAAEYEDGILSNSTWSEGDWNADGDFDTGDLVLAFQSSGFEAGPRFAVRSVPEPNRLGLMLSSLLIVGLRRRLSKSPFPKFRK